MANLAQTLRQVGYVTPQGQVTGPNAPLAQQLKNYVTNVIPTAAQNLAQQRADIDAAITMGQNGIQIGDREAFERQMAQVPNLMGLTAYHGTPHTIKGKFDISKVGTGEGAQAYGHGMYFAENPAVAKEYQKALSGRTDLGQQPSDPAFIHAVESFREAGTPLSVIPAEMKKAYKSATDKDIQLAIQATEKGNLYKVDIPDADIPMMMDLDKPLSQQPKVMGALRAEAEQRVKDRTLVNIENDIRSSLPPIDIGNDYMAMFSDANVKAGQEIKKQALEKLNKMDLSSLVNKELESMKPLAMNWNMTGKEYYEFLAKNQGSPAKASEMLQRQGITGNRYLDEVSRNRGQGTSNFVVFEPSNVKILEQNSKPLTRKEILEQELKKVVE
jgi:hypothetical protein